MDSRLFFVLGDLFGKMLTGLVVGVLCSLVVGEGWNMFLAMCLAMAIGMAVGLVMFFPLGIFFGAMEVMLPVMFTGMASGMVVGMYCAMAPLTAGAAALWGAVCGLASIVLIWVLNTGLRGVTTYSDGGRG